MTTSTELNVTAIRTYVVAVSPGINWVFLKVETDSELYGWGECTLEGKDLSVLGALEEVGRSLIGRPVPPPLAAWSAAFRMTPWRGAGTMTAISGIDHALWDLAGKRAGLPVARLLGGPVRDEVQLYTWAGSDDDPAALADVVAEARETFGFTHFKVAPLERFHTLDPGGLRRAVARVEAVAAALPEDGRVAVEGHGRLQAPAAANLAHALTSLPLLFLEDLVHSDDEAAMRSLRARTDAPLAAGERRFSRQHAWPLLREGLVDYLLIDLCHAGGITESVRIAATAEAAGIPVVPHNPNGPIGMAATLHAAAASPNIVTAESVRTRFPLMERLTGQPVGVRDGAIAVPTGPGLGVELDEDALIALAGEPADFPFPADAAISNGRL